jgi:hypothetical protein
LINSFGLVAEPLKPFIKKTLLQVMRIMWKLKKIVKSMMAAKSFLFESRYSVYWKSST